MKAWCTLSTILPAIIQLYERGRTRFTTHNIVRTCREPSIEIRIRQEDSHQSSYRDEIFTIRLEVKKRLKACQAVQPTECTFQCIGSEINFETGLHGGYDHAHVQDCIGAVEIECHSARSGMMLRDVFLPFLKDVVTESRHRDSMGTTYVNGRSSWTDGLKVMQL